MINETAATKFTATRPPLSCNQCNVARPELIGLFAVLYPLTIQDATDNDIRARVCFAGTPFDIVPEPCPGRATKFSVWGPPYATRFPDSL